MGNYHRSRKFRIEDFRTPDPPKLEYPAVRCDSFVVFQLQAMQRSVADLHV